MMCGGTGDLKDATEEIQELVNLVRENFESSEGKTFDQFKAISYKSQVVAGTNYFVKVQVSENDFVHLRVFKPLPGQGEPQLAASQTGKSLEDALDYFEKA